MVQKKKAVKKRARKAKTPVKAPTPTPKANKLELLLKSITEHFPKDPSAPGLALSYLPAEHKDFSCGSSRPRFYGAIRRFKGYAGTQPEVIISYRGETLLKTLNILAERWREYVKPQELSATKEFLRALLDPHRDTGSCGDPL